MRLRISQPEMPTALGQPVEAALHGELGLVGAEAPERPADRVVRADGHGAHVDGRHVVRAAGVPGRPLQHLHARRRRRRPSRRSSGRGPRSGGPRHRTRPRYAISIGWRLGCMRRLSSRESMHFTGRCSNQAASAGWAWLAMSSLPPKAPPFDTSSTVIRCGLDAEHRGDLVAVVPDALSARVDVHGLLASGSGTASVASGSRKACSMRWVRKVSSHDVRAGAQRGVGVAPPVLGHRERVGVRSPHRELGIVERGRRIGERPQHAVVDRRPARPPPGPAGGSRPRRWPARRRCRTCGRPRGS